MRPTPHFRFVLAAAALLVSAAATAQERRLENPAAPVNKERIDAALKLTQSEAGKYEFTLGDAANSSATLHKDPILKWSNPAVGEIHGNVFLWTVDGRPAAVGSLFKWFTPHTHMSHEFHSLSEVPLAVRYADQEVWRTKTGGVSFVAAPGAPSPAATANRRLLQMREIAKGFAATKTERDGNQTELRLLPQPIYRYAAVKQGIIDGALFVLVQGTDPEVFVLLEARGDSDANQWMLAAARMNSAAFDLRYRDSTIWNVEIMPSKDISSHALPYTTFMFKMP